MGEFSINISLPTDEEGFTGRECPECKEYFKVKFGTGLDTDNCICPYCNYEDNYDEFMTRAQNKYVDSVIDRDIEDRIVGPLMDKLDKSLKRMERSTRGSFIQIRVGISNKRKYFRLNRYQEKQLETSIVCDNCNLEFAIYGVFSTCPDCKELSAISIFKKSLESVQKRIHLAREIEDKEISISLIEDALSKSVSTFDGLGKALQKKFTHKLPKTRNLFQKVDILSDVLYESGGKNLPDLIGEKKFSFLVEMFNARHLFEHSFGEIDEAFIKKVPKYSNKLKRKYPLNENKLVDLVNLLNSVGAIIISELNK